MNNREIKQEIKNALFNRGYYIRQVDENEILTRCPFCGDALSENKGHFYIRLNPNDNYPILYNCFKCEEKGVMKKDTLELLEIYDGELKANIGTLNKTSTRIDSKGINSNMRVMNFEYKIPDIKRGKKTKYIEDRLNLKFDDEEFMDMKVITSLKDFLILNDIHTIGCPQFVAEKMEDHYVGFLSNGNSHILFRDITGKEDYRWVKYPITKESKNNRLFYSMASSVDVFTNDDITINLTEGVMDILSACYNLGGKQENTINIAVTGKYYGQILTQLIDMGLVGSNVIVNIYSDNDEQFGKKQAKLGTTLAYYKKILANIKHLYKEVNVYYNTIGKDIGVPRDEICLKKYRL